MVNAGLLPATVTLNIRAAFWSKVLPHLTVYPDTVLKHDGQVALVTRKDSSQLKALLDEFVQTHDVGTSFGNTLLRRYLQNTKWVTDATTTQEMKQFQACVRYFQKYANQYDFDYFDVGRSGIPGIPPRSKLQESQWRCGHHAGHTQVSRRPSH
jgi:membrane-bound lytic murein transglycosylase MltF